MALVRAFNAGISGLQAFQFRVDTIGDNLANVDTNGFKSVRVDFRTLLSQTASFGSAPTGGLGGIDPVQVGLGATVKTTNKDFSQGALKSTGRKSDLAMEGDGFFVLEDGAGAQAFTRDGAFGLNPTSFLVNPGNGFFVQGIQADFSTFLIPGGAAPTDIEIPVGSLRIARETTTGVFDGNLDGAGAIANSGTVIESETFLQLAGPPGARLPVVGGQRAGLGTLLIELGRQTSGPSFLDFQMSDGTIDADGDGLIDPPSVITVQSIKGGKKILPAQRFEVAPTSTTPPTPGNHDAGSTLRDFLDFLEDVLGINDSGSATIDPTYGGFINRGSALAAAGVPVSSITFADPGGTIAGQLEVGDYIRFTSGDGAGQTSALTIPPVTVAGITTLTFTPLDTSRPMPSVGNNFELNEPARVTLGTLAPPVLDPFPGQDATLPIPPEPVPADALDDDSLGGRIRISGNAGLQNAISNLEITFGATRLTTFSQLTAATGESTVANATFFDSLGTPHLVELTYVLESKSDRGNRFRWFAEAEDNNVAANNGADRVVGTGFIQFDPDGRFISESSVSGVILDLSLTGAVSPLTVVVDHSSLTGFSSQLSEVALIDQDGFELGTLRDFAVSAEGVVKGVFSNGQVRDIAQVVTARFANNNGLSDLGGNLFAVGINSGLPLIGPPGSFGRGVIRAGFLEGSNVDIAVQFTDLITSQRSFQANARTITVANEMLQDLVNLV